MPADDRGTPSFEHGGDSRRRHRGPFPVTIVRPATGSPPTARLTAQQRQRQLAANHDAHRITENARSEYALHALSFWDQGDLTDLVDLVEAVRAVVQQAPGIAVPPPAPAVRVGRNLRGDVAVAVLHAASWSLLMVPGVLPTALLYHDRLGELPILFTPGADLLGVQWSDMVQTVFTTLTTSSSGAVVRDTDVPHDSA